MRLPRWPGVSRVNRSWARGGEGEPGALSETRTLTSVRDDAGKEGRILSTLPISFRRVRPTFWEGKGRATVTFCLPRTPCFPWESTPEGQLPSEASWD